jgi:hypothetical protein
MFALLATAMRKPEGLPVTVAPSFRPASGGAPESQTRTLTAALKGAWRKRGTGRTVADCGAMSLRGRTP